MPILMAVTGSWARTLTPEEALQRVNSSDMPLKAMPATASSPGRLVHTARTSTGMPAVYLFDRAESGGYMLVSADDIATPLLGYSDVPVGEGGELPPSMQWWLEQYAVEIEQASSGMSMRVVDSSRAAGDVSSFTPIAPLCDTKWNQDAPYNNQCPLINWQRTYTGCLATALAQVMKYHEWPEHGTGSITYTDVNRITRTMDFDVAFDWDNMLDVYDKTATTVQNDAVALLMKACGHAVQMNYGTSSSGATDLKVPGALKSYFGYSGDVNRCVRSYYGLADWQSMIYKNLKEVGPVLYCGSSHLGGHAFVCDGYSTDGYFHFNWGWGGAYDGYFRLTALNPEGAGIGGFSGGYNMYQTVILGVKKPDGNPVSVRQQLSQASPLTGRIVAGNNLTVTSGWFNETSDRMRFSFGLRLEPIEDTAGEVSYVESASYRNLSLESEYGWNSFPLTFNIQNVPSGTYRASVVTKNEDAPAQGWLPALHPMNMVDYVILKKGVQGSSVSAVNAGEITVVSSELLTGLFEGCSAKLRMDVANNSDVEVAEALAPALLSGNALVAAGGGIYFDLMPGESDSRELVFDFAISQSFRPNTTYTCCLYNPETNVVRYNLGNVQVLSNPGKPKLTATSFNLEGGTAAADCSRLHFIADIKCISGYLASPLTLLITPQGGGTAVASGNSTEALFLNSGESCSSDIIIAFPEGQVGEKYTAFLGYVFGNSFVQLRYLDFTVGATGAVEMVEAGTSDIEIAYDRNTGRALVAAPRNIAAISVATPAGASLNVPVENSGCSASVDFAELGSSVVILTVVCENGYTKTVKLAL